MSSHLEQTETTTRTGPVKESRSQSKAPAKSKQTDDHEEYQGRVTRSKTPGKTKKQQKPRYYDEKSEEESQESFKEKDLTNKKMTAKPKTAKSTAKTSESENSGVFGK